jgi:hypothetical protein
VHRVKRATYLEILYPCCLVSVQWWNCVARYDLGFVGDQATHRSMAN